MGDDTVITDQITDLVADLGGVATRAQLVRVLHRTRLDDALAEGVLLRIARGRYVVASTAPLLVAASCVGGVVTGLSAAQWWGWGLVRDPARPEVTVPRDRVARREDVDVRRRDLPLGSSVGHVLTRAHTVVDVARWHPFDVALCVADSALRDGSVGRDEVRQAARTVPRTGRRRVARVVDLASPTAANPFESVTRAWAVDVVDLRLVPQCWVEDIGRADLADVDLRIVVECESWAYHSGEQPFRHDVRRYTAMTRAGWLVVRFVWEDVMHRPEVVAAALTDLVALRRRDTQFASVFAVRRSAG